MRARLIAVDRDGNPTRLDWPIDSLGNSNVPRVGERVVLPDRTVVVHEVLWFPLGDEDPTPFVVITARGTW